MPKPQIKDEKELREYQIIDAMRADVEQVVKDYRRRVGNLMSEEIERYRKSIKVVDGVEVLPAIDAKYRNDIRYRFARRVKELGRGSV